ncbi:Conserved_hypothetical protein [Hexamita inflata]|uniref:Uncharacterized protein n=1 Tax=Hexamita inflata TaxID=28002 RepID=A0AA86REJ7_9EUKA|nr:Conserved hypothetical protein [Hexamita inflata]
MTMSQIFKDKAIETLVRSESASKNVKISYAVSQVRENTKRQLALSTTGLMNSVLRSNSPSYLAPPKETKSQVLRSSSTQSYLDKRTLEEASKIKPTKYISTEEKDQIFDKLYQDFKEKQIRGLESERIDQNCTFRPKLQYSKENLKTELSIQHGLELVKEVQAEKRAIYNQQQELAKQLTKPAQFLIKSTIPIPATLPRADELHSKAKVYSDKIKALKEAQDKKNAELQKKQHTFQPDLYKNPNIVLTLEEDTVKRMTQLTEYTREKKRRAIINKNNREMEKCPFKPEIQKFKFSTQQQEIMSAPVFDRLYVEGKLQNIMKDETIQKHYNEITFTPRINDNALELTQSRNNRLKEISLNKEQPATPEQIISQIKAKRTPVAEYARKMNEIYEKGLDFIDLRQEFATLGESTSIILANTLHTTKNSDKLAEMKRKRFVQRIYSQLMKLSSAPTVNYSYCAEFVQELECGEKVKMMVLEVLVKLGATSVVDQEMFYKTVVMQINEYGQQGMDYAFTEMK